MAEEKIGYFAFLDEAVRRVGDYLKSAFTVDSDYTYPDKLSIGGIHEWKEVKWPKIIINVSNTDIESIAMDHYVDRYKDSNGKVIGETFGGLGFINIDVRIGGLTIKEMKDLTDKVLIYLLIARLNKNILSGEHPDFAGHLLEMSASDQGTEIYGNIEVFYQEISLKIRTEYYLNLEQALIEKINVAVETGMV